MGGRSAKTTACQRQQNMSEIICEELRVTSPLLHRGLSIIIASKYKHDLARRGNRNLSLQY